MQACLFVPKIDMMYAVCVAMVLMLAGCVIPLPAAGSFEAFHLDVTPVLQLVLAAHLVIA